MCPAATSRARPSGNFRPSLMMVFKSDPSGFADSTRPALRSRNKSLLDVAAAVASAPIGVDTIALIKRISSLTWLCVARVQSARPTSVGLRTQAVMVRWPERREAPAEVKFEIAPNTVTDAANLGAARLCTGQGQQWEEQVGARLKLGSCRRPEPIDLGLRRG